MTPDDQYKERAEKYLLWANKPHTGKQAVDFIAAEIRAAVEERKGNQWAANPSEWFCLDCRPLIHVAATRAKADAYEDAAKICDERIEDEMRIAMGTKGQGKFQCQAAIDALGEVSEAIRTRAKELDK